MENTGGPNQKWNVRREYSAKPADRRELYYSGVDRRIHLKHAKEGWLQVGHFAGLGTLGEIRMFDMDGNGYFDRWEYDFGDWRRVVCVSDERAEDVPWDFDAVSARYMETILPGATAANQQFMAAMNALRPFEPDPRLAAANATPGSFQRYAQDVLREVQYAEFYTYWSDLVEGALASFPMDDLQRLNADARGSQCTSQTAWDLRCVLSRLDHLYNHGDLDGAARLLESSGQVFRVAQEQCGGENTP